MFPKVSESEHPLLKYSTGAPPGFCGPRYTLECCEKYKSFKLKIPQPDSEQRHSPDFRTVFEIMIGPFFSCEIGKTWGTENEKKPYIK